MTRHTTEARKRRARAGGLWTVSAICWLTCCGLIGPATNAATSQAANAQSSARPARGACAYLPVAQADRATARKWTSTAAATISTGEGQCTYTDADFDTLVIIVYQPNSGVTFSMLLAVEKSTGTVKMVKGLGDKAAVGSIELDVQVGRRLLAVQGAGGTLTGHYAPAVAIAKDILPKLR
jgi:hypothetical protein